MLRLFIIEGRKRDASVGRNLNRWNAFFAAGAAAVVLARGADAVYLFNYFPGGHPGWPRPVYQKTLLAMNSIDSLRKLPRGVGLTYRDIRASGEKYRPPLPASGKKLSFSIDPGPLPVFRWECVLTVSVKPPKDQPASSPKVSVNGQSCRSCGEESKDEFRVLSFLVPNEALTGDKPLKI